MGFAPSAGSMSALIPILVILGITAGPVFLLLGSQTGRSSIKRLLAVCHNFFYEDQSSTNGNTASTGQGTAVSATSNSVAKPSKAAEQDAFDANPEVDNFDFSIFTDQP